ncbi:MAG: type II secretion system major pseudopilin GspG [Candidatus Omnitrophica bacterium]|nr:type II secretion system major pseudopilin GspG [Candidatus Omnitrophota bacterium]
MNALKRKRGPTVEGGFTLVEIMLVVVIIATIAGMVLPRLSGRSDQAKVAATQVDIESNIATALKLFELDNGFFPTTDQGLEALIVKPTMSPLPKNWNGPYLERRPRDAWSRPYIYKCPGTHGFDYDLYSLGRDDRESDDDVTNWK